MISQSGHFQIPTLFDVLNTNSGEEGFTQVGHDASSSFPVNLLNVMLLADSISAGIIYLSTVGQCSSASGADKAGRGCPALLLLMGRLDMGAGVTSPANLGNPF